MTQNSSLTRRTLHNVSKGDEDEVYEGFFDPKADVVPLVLAVLIVSVNTLVLVVMSRKSSLQSNTNLLLCSLAASDLLTGLVSVPLFIACNIVRQSTVCILEEQMSRFISASIVSHLMSVTTDRYLAIVHPLRYNSLVTRPKCTMVILFIWLLSAVSALLQFTWLNPFNHDVNEEPSSDATKAELIYDIVFLILFFFLPFAFMSFTYTIITIEVIRQSRNIRKQCTPCLRRNGSRTRHERKAVAFFVVMLFVYITCWLPYFCLRRIDSSVFPIPLVYVIFWLRYVASLLNPCMYIIGKQDIRKTIYDSERKRRNNFTSMSRPTVLRRTTATGEEGLKESMLLRLKHLSKAETADSQ